MPLVFVPTPLGNLRDITLRAIDVLREAEVIVCEDTRVTAKLLHLLQLDRRELWSYREQNAASVTPGILERARTSVVAVVTDAGMPAVSDPGAELVAAARAAGVAVDVLPGPSAALGVAVLSGFPLRRFTFEGFPPRKTGARREAFAAALALGATSIWYESPERIHETLADLDALAPAVRVFVVREYTKRFEQQLEGTPLDVARRIEIPVRGEIAFAIGPYEARAPERTADDVTAEIDALLAMDYTVAEVARRLAEQGYGERRDLYRQASDRKRAHGMGGAAAAEDHAR